MIATYTLDSMAEKAPRRDKPFYGRVIESRRAFLGKKSAMVVENETGGVIYQKLLYRIEGGNKDPLTLDLTQFSALLKALEWTPEEFARETKLALPKALRRAAAGPDRARSPEPRPRGPHLTTSSSPGKERGQVCAAKTNTFRSKRSCKASSTSTSSRVRI